MKLVKEHIEGLYTTYENSVGTGTDDDIKLSELARKIIDVINTRFNDIQKQLEACYIDEVFGCDAETKDTYMFNEETNFMVFIESMENIIKDDTSIVLYEPFINYFLDTDEPNYQRRQFFKTQAFKILEKLAEKYSTTVYNDLFGSGFFVSDKSFDETKKLFINQYIDSNTEIFDNDNNMPINRTIITSLDDLKEVVGLFMDIDIDRIINSIKETYKELSFGYIFDETKIMSERSNGGYSKEIFYKYIKDGKNINYKIDILSESYTFQSYVKLYAVDKKSGLNFIRAQNPKNDYNIDFSYRKDVPVDGFDRIIKETIEFIKKLNK